MKKVVDERLKLQLVKNFKIAFLVENAVIILMLIYQSFKNMDKAISASNPVWTAFITGTMTLSLLSVNVTASIEDKPKRSTIILFRAYIYYWQFIFYGCNAKTYFTGFALWDSNCGNCIWSFNL